MGTDRRHDHRHPGHVVAVPGCFPRTLRLLVPDDGVPRVDAVVFLLRTLNAADIALLKMIGELVGGSAGALWVIGWRRGPTRSARGDSTR